MNSWRFATLAGIYLFTFTDDSTADQAQYTWCPNDACWRICWNSSCTRGVLVNYPYPLLVPWNYTLGCPHWFCIIISWLAQFPTTQRARHYTNILGRPSICLASVPQSELLVYNYYIGQPQSQGSAEAVEEKTEFTVKLVKYAEDSKIKLIKEVKTLVEGMNLVQVCLLDQTRQPCLEM